MSGKVRIGVIGAGYMATSTHLPCLSEIVEIMHIELLSERDG